MVDAFLWLVAGIVIGVVLVGGWILWWFRDYRPMGY